MDVSKVTFRGDGIELRWKKEVVIIFRHCWCCRWYVLCADSIVTMQNVPSVLISDFNGAMLRTGLKEGAMQMKMEWNLPLLESSTLELWTSCEDNAGACATIF